jgi:hypothetical protein
MEPANSAVDEAAYKVFFEPKDWWMTGNRTLHIRFDDGHVIDILLPDHLTVASGERLALKLEIPLA